MPEPWEKQPGESRQAFHAFTHYRDMGEGRSLDKAYREHREGCVGQQQSNTRATGRWTSWLVDWHWTQRAEAYDAHVDRQARIALLEEVKEARRRHLLQARYLQGLGMGSLRNMPADSLPAATAIRAAEVGMKWESLLLGQPTEQYSFQEEEDKEHDRKIRLAILRDPIAAELACRLAESLDGAESPDTGPPGLDSH